MEGTRLSELDPKRNEKAWRERERGRKRERERRETNGRMDDKKLSSELDSWSEGEREIDKGSLEARVERENYAVLIWGQRLMRGLRGAHIAV